MGLGSMGRGSRKGNRLPPFVALTWSVLNSQAYKELPHSAGKVLPYFLGKVKVNHNDPQRHMIDFPFSYREAKNYGFASTTHHRVIAELIRKGFIDPVDKGGLRSGGLTSSFFRLSTRWVDYGTNKFKEIGEWSDFYPSFKKIPNINNGNLQHQKRNKDTK